MVLRKSTTAVILRAVDSLENVRFPAFQLEADRQETAPFRPYLECLGGHRKSGIPGRARDDVGLRGPAMMRGRVAAGGGTGPGGGRSGHPSLFPSSEPSPFRFRSCITMTIKRPPDWLIAPHLRTESVVREEQAPYLAHHPQRPAGAPSVPPAPQDGLTQCSCYVPIRPARQSPIQQRTGTMQHDLRLRAVARAIYDACFPTEEIAPVGFEEAERYGTIHYRRAVEAAQAARSLCAGGGTQLDLVLA